MNKKVIEDILNKLIKSYDNNKKLKDKYNEDTMRFILNVEESEILLNYIADLQRKEYNNSKAIEYGKELRLFDNESLEFEIGTNFINILEKGE